MKVLLHPHAKDRLIERGVTEAEVKTTVSTGEAFSAKFNRTGFRKNFSYGRIWKDRMYLTKQVEAYAAKESGSWLVITVVTKFF